MLLRSSWSYISEIMATSIHQEEVSGLNVQVTDAVVPNLSPYTKDGTVDLYGRPAIRTTTGRYKAASIILVNQGLVSIGYYAVVNNLVRYLTNVFHEGNASAARNVNNWTGTTSITALIGAYFADAYIGRFYASVIFLIVYILGMILLTLSASIPVLSPKACASSDPSHCEHASVQQAAFLYFALYLSALGAGGYQPCNSAFGADQFDDEDSGELHGKSLYFNYFYLSMIIPSFIASTLVLYVEEDVSWTWGFGISTIFLGLSLLVFLCGISLYRYHKPAGNPFARVAHVFVAAFYKRHSQAPVDADVLYEPTSMSSKQAGRKILHTNEFRLLDKAAIITVQDNVQGEEHDWRLCTVTQVEEVKCILRILPIWLSTIMYSTAYSQMTTVFVEQGSTMNRKMGSFEIPPGSLTAFDTISVVLWALIYHWALLPLSKSFKWTKEGLTTLQRMGIGFIAIIMAMIAAAIVETYRLKLVMKYGVADNPDAVVPMSVFWQVPQYFLVGASEVFHYIAQMEFFYEQSPDPIRGLGSALQLAGLAIGGYVSSLLVTIVTRFTKGDGNGGWISDNLNHGHLDYFFWLLAGLTTLDFLLFIFLAHLYKYIQMEKT